KQLRHARHAVVKCGVEAGHLGKLRVPLLERLDQFNLTWQMVGVVGCDAMQFTQQLRRDGFWLGVLHAVDEAMAYASGRLEIWLFREPVQQELDRGLVIGGGKIASLSLFRSRVIERQVRPVQTNAVNLSVGRSL